MFHFCLDRKNKRGYFIFLMDKDWRGQGCIRQSESLTCQSNCADVQNRICWFLSDSVWKFIDSYCLKGYNEVISTISAPGQVCTQTVNGKEVGWVFHHPSLQVQETWSFLQFVIRGSKNYPPSLLMMNPKTACGRTSLNKLGRGKFWQSFEVTFVLPIVLTWTLWLKITHLPECDADCFRMSVGIQRPETIASLPFVFTNGNVP